MTVFYKELCLKYTTDLQINIQTAGSSSTIRSQVLNHIFISYYFLKITINSKLSFPFEWLLGRILAERKFSPIQNSPTAACLEKINRKKNLLEHFGLFVDQQGVAGVADS